MLDKPQIGIKSDAPEKDAKNKEHPVIEETNLEHSNAPYANHADNSRKTLRRKVRRILVGKPRDLTDTSIFHKLSLIPFLAWVGLGADGLSSSAYGPQEAFVTLQQHTYLAAGLAVVVAATVFIIASAYSRIIEHFPHGGGGYTVATKLLGSNFGVISGSALLVDYVLTITVSIAAAGDALFSFMPIQYHHLLKLPAEFFLIIFLTVLNIRGVKESVMALMPIFIIFLITHVILIGASIFIHLPQMPAVAHGVATGFSQDAATIGLGGMLLLFINAYSMGGGTYTGLEAVSNGMPIMREPRVQTAKRTMAYMAFSLAFTAGGLLVCYLLLKVKYTEGTTLNYVLARSLTSGWPLGGTFVFVTMFAAAALLIVGAQAGFLDGPRVLSNMAVDWWVPRSFASLSERLTTQNGIVLMGICSAMALMYTKGNIGHLVVMYSINVFVTFSLSMFAMLRFWLGEGRVSGDKWKRNTAIFLAGFVLCVTILAITVYVKFMAGGWVTVFITGALVFICFMIRRHYRAVMAQLRGFNKILDALPQRNPNAIVPPLNPALPTAAVMVGGYSGTGVHMLLNILKSFPGHFKNAVFLSVGVIDSGQFKGEAEMRSLRESTQKALEQYVDLAERLGFAATSRFAIGTDVGEEAENLAVEIQTEFPHSTFFSGQIIFQQENWYHRFLHNQTSFDIQKRLQWRGMTMVILPMRVEK